MINPEGCTKFGREVMLVHWRRLSRHLSLRSLSFSILIHYNNSKEVDVQTSFVFKRMDWEANIFLLCNV
ncbi:hypothetical protein ACB092_07G042300 [Castanea dentata]